jgi:plastocyanin
MLFFSTALVLAAIPAAVLGAVQTITVGAGGKLAFSPSNITAAAGDQINFEFQAKNHVCHNFS